MTMSTSILLSIYPQFVDKILSGEKRFEYRTQLPSRQIDRIFIYATAPVQQCIAVAEVEEIIATTPTKLWQQTKYASGISHSDFMAYFHLRKIAYAYKLGRVYPILNGVKKLIAPQSFKYLSEEEQHETQIKDIPCFQDRMIFVAGIHGIGKTYFLEKTMMPLGYKCASASLIIKEMRGNVQNNKRTKGIEKNQELLINGVAKYKMDYTRLAIDGHFVLLNADNEFTALDEDVFSALAPSCIILLSTRKPSLVQQHLITRDSNCTWSIPFIRQFLKNEKRAAIRISHNLHIPLIEYDIEQKITSILSKIKFPF